MTTRLTDRELATVLAALRYWQQDLAANEGASPLSHHFNRRITPLRVEEIDDLSERLNCKTAARESEFSTPPFWS